MTISICYQLVNKSSSARPGARVIEKTGMPQKRRRAHYAQTLKPPADKPGHYLMPIIARISHGQRKGKRGYEPNQHQQCRNAAWYSLTEKAGSTELRFHDLRHTFITRMIELGVPSG